MDGMDKETLKEILKPILKESIREVLLEEGLLKMLSEVKANEVKASVKKPTYSKEFVKDVKPVAEAKDQKQEEAHQKMRNELKKKGLLTNKFDPFAGTKPLTEAQAVGNGMARDPQDEGIDISGIMDIAAGKWQAHLGGKRK
jgi:hypothetical protein